MDDYGLDLDEVARVIDAAEVLVVRFAILDKRLLIDARKSETEGPVIAVVPKASSVEERFKALKKLRPRLPLPEKIMSFMWPRQMETFLASGLWDKIEGRMVSLGGEGIMCLDEGGAIRMVTHYGIDRGDVEEAAAAVRSLVVAGA